MRNRRLFALISAVIYAACPKSEAPAKRREHTSTPPAAKVQTRNFEVSGGTAEARAHFQKGIDAIHAFWYEEAAHQFQAAIDADKTFTFAYWGLAMTKSKLIWGDDEVTAARDALTHIEHPETLSPREQAWIAAARALFADGNVITSRKAFVSAMENINTTYPDDESATFLSVALLAVIRPGDPQEGAIRERAAALAKEVFERNPKHPGAAHYLIHAYDTPSLAPKALHAARIYASIAPEAFHARHMPAHIFSRLGMWQEAITSCQSAWDASVSWAKREHLNADNYDYHSLNWLVEMNFELGKRKAADAAMKVYMDSVRGGLNRLNRIAYLQQVNSYIVRTEDWNRINELLAPLKSKPNQNSTGTGGIISAKTSGPSPSAASCPGHPSSSSQPPLDLFEERAVLMIRARAAAMQHDVSKTKKLLDQLANLETKVRPHLLATQPKEYVDIQERAQTVKRDMLLARARGDNAAVLQAAQQNERTTRESTAEGTASAFLAHEILADALLDFDKNKEAWVAYEEVVRDHPGRAHSMLGAARAAHAAGDVATSRDWYQKLLKLWSGAEENTKGLDEARKAVAGASMPTPVGAD